MQPPLLHPNGSRTTNVKTSVATVLSKIVGANGTSEVLVLLGMTSNSDAHPGMQ